MIDRPESERLEDLSRIRATYARYRASQRDRIWDVRNPGFARIVNDRDAELIRLLRSSCPDEAEILDVGFGDGRLAARSREDGLPIGRWTGVELDPDSVTAACAAIPWARWLEASADRLPFADASFDIAVASTLFSSISSADLEHAAAREIARVVRPGGWVVWYDLRYDNPSNPAVHGIDEKELRSLFPSWAIEVRSMTLLPPLARRLGPLTPVAYPVLQALPPLRSHLVGRLQKPAIGT